MKEPMRLKILDKGQRPVEAVFSDISSEVSRTYEFADGAKVTIEAPDWLHVSASGGHRLIDHAGRSHYVPVGWHHLSWTVKDGEPPFVR